MARQQATFDGVDVIKIFPKSNISWKFQSIVAPSSLVGSLSTGIMPHATEMTAVIFIIPFGKIWIYRRLDDSENGVQFAWVISQTGGKWVFFRTRFSCLLFHWLLQQQQQNMYKLSSRWFPFLLAKLTVGCVVVGFQVLVDQFWIYILRLLIFFICLFIQSTERNSIYTYWFTKLQGSPFYKLLTLRQKEQATNNIPFRIYHTESMEDHPLLVAASIEEHRSVTRGRRLPLETPR